MRIDKYLWCIRIFKTRTLATTACKKGQIKIDNKNIKPSKEVFGDELTTDLEEFNTTDKTIALQIVSGREGISLSKADFLIMFNIDFSATSYWQSRDRMTTKGRTFNKVYWIFSENGIESAIYKAVSNKKNYTLSHFKKDF